VVASFLKGGSEDTLSVLERFWLVPTSKGMRGDTGSGTTISAIPAPRRRGAAAGGGSGRRKILPGASDQPGTGLHRGLGAL